MLLHINPDDEFDYKYRSLTKQINEELPVEEIAKVISALFSKMFAPASFGVEKCVTVTLEIKTELLKQKKK